MSLTCRNAVGIKNTLFKPSKMLALNAIRGFIESSNDIVWQVGWGHLQSAGRQQSNSLSRKAARSKAGIETVKPSLDYTILA